LAVANSTVTAEITLNANNSGFIGRLTKPGVDGQAMKSRLVKGAIGSLIHNNTTERAKPPVNNRRPLSTELSEANAA
jgi:hypothetical protein